MLFWGQKCDRPRDRNPYHRAPSGRRPYGRDAFDIAALVVLAENVVKFVPNIADSYTIRARDIGSLCICPMRSLDDSLPIVMSATQATAI